MRPLIALTGFRGCGKNFYFEKVFEKWEFQTSGLFPETIKFKNFAFADLLKIYCEKIYGFSLEEIEKYKRDNSKKFKVGNLELTMREILVRTANSLRDLTNDAFWAELTISYIQKWLMKYEKGGETIIPVITDLRFYTELSFLKPYFNVLTIYIQSQCEDCLKELKNVDEQEVIKIKELANIKENLPCYENFHHEDQKWLRSQVFDHLEKLLNKI